MGDWEPIRYRCTKEVYSTSSKVGYEEIRKEGMQRAGRCAAGAGPTPAAPPPRPAAARAALRAHPEHPRRTRHAAWGARETTRKIRETALSDTLLASILRSFVCLRRPVREYNSLSNLLFGQGNLLLM